MAKKTTKEQQYKKSLLNTPMLNYDVYVMGMFETVFVNLASFILGGLVGLVFYGNLFQVDGEATRATYISNVVVFVIVGIIGIRFLVPMYKDIMLNRRKNKLKNQFRDFLESLSSSFLSGSNERGAFETALADMKMQYGDKDYIVLEIQEIVDGIYQNLNVSAMLKDFGERSGNEDIISFADVFVICSDKGGSMNTVINRTHSIISEKIQIADEIETKLTSNKMQLNVMSLMPIVIVIMLRSADEMFADNFATPMGVLINTVAIGIFIGAYLYGQKIVDIKG